MLLWVKPVLQYVLNLQTHQTNWYNVGILTGKYRVNCVASNHALHIYLNMMWWYSAGEAMNEGEKFMNVQYVRFLRFRVQYISQVPAIIHNSFQMNIYSRQSRRTTRS